MQIEFRNVHDGNERRSGIDLSILEAEEVRGDLEILFEGDHTERFARNDVSVPLTIAELKLFVSRLKARSVATWLLSFAPFLDGRLENGSIRLMEGSRDHASGKTVEFLSPDQVRGLELRIADLERRYGRLAPSPNALQKAP